MPSKTRPPVCLWVFLILYILLAAPPPLHKKGGHTPIPLLGQVCEKLFYKVSTQEPYLLDHGISMTDYGVVLENIFFSSFIAKAE